MDKPASIITAFVMERLDNEPLTRRITLTRALAQFADNNAERRALASMADDLESVQRRHQQLLLNFRNKSA